MPRNAFDFHFWVPGWANPFESRKSIYQKYAWLNDASPREHSILSSAWPEDKHRRLYAQLSSAVIDIYRTPYVHLWELTQFSNAICQICLNAGYWSELPQMAGHELCPLHGIALQRLCGECHQPIWFGCPRFPETGAFVCNSCRNPLTPFPEKACLQWRSIPQEVIVNAFSPLSIVARRLAAECSGFWRFPSPSPSIEDRLIVHSFTGNSIKLDREVNLPFSSDVLHAHVVPMTFELPCDDKALVCLLKHEQDKMLVNLRRQYPRIRFKQKESEDHLKIKMGWTTHEVDFKRGGYLVNNMEVLLNSLSQERQKKTHWIFVDYLKSEIETYVLKDQISRQVCKILLALSGFQICLVLARLESLVVALIERFSNSDCIDDDSYSVLNNQPYGIRLKWGRVDEEHFVFNVDSCAWMPPYRLRNTERGTELTIFQISQR